MNVERCGCLALAWLMLSSAHAGEANGHSAVLSVHGDENGSRQSLGRLALSLGDHIWLQGSLGQTEFGEAEPMDTSIVGAALGVRGDTISAAVEMVQRQGDARFEQQDWAATVNWRAARGGVGADLFLRSASSESTTTRPSGSVFAPPATTTVRESVDGKGFGLHGDFYVTPQVNLFAGAMHYRYDLNVDSTVAGDGTLLSSLFGSNAAFSGVWRDQALIDRSYRVGGSYRAGSAAVSVEYFRDWAAHGGDRLDTVQLQAEFAAAGRWLISPTLGYSSTGPSGSTAYAGLALGVNW